jgi:hypothetical protein
MAIPSCVPDVSVLDRGDGRPPAAGTIAALPPAERALLCTLRAAMRTHRIGAAPRGGVAAAAVALIAALDSGAERAMVLHPDRDASLAFAEAWLLGLVRALARGDRESAGFLVARCVAKPWRRAILSAASRLADAAGDHA